MWDTSARLLRLLSLLQVRDWSGPELADRLAVDVRTVRRDVERLRSLGYPVESTPGWRAATGWAPAPTCRPCCWTTTRPWPWRSGCAPRPTAPWPGSRRPRCGPGPARAGPPARLRHRVGALGAATVALPGPRPTVDADLLTQVAAACRATERLRFDYRDHGGATSRRTVEPYRLAHTGRLWYLVAWDAGRRDWRTFRVDRIASTPVPATGSHPGRPPMAAWPATWPGR